MHLIPSESASLQLYSPQKHFGLRFHLHDNISFARHWLFLPVHKREALRLYKQVPIVFYKDHQEQLSLAVLLFDQNGHVIKGPKQCRLSYLPVAFRLYPFSWVDQNNTSRVAIYSNAPHFQGQGEKLFTSKTKPTQRMRTIMQHIGLARTEYQKTQPLLELLATRVTFKQIGLSLMQKGESKQVGFLAIDQDTLKLDEFSGELRELIRAHCLSLKMLQTNSRKEVVATSSAESVVTDTEQKIAETPDQLIKQVCDKFDLSLDDLLSRKRGELLMSARKVLAQSAEQQGMLDALAQKLGRTVQTLKRWNT